MSEDTSRATDSARDRPTVAFFVNGPAYLVGQRVYMHTPNMLGLPLAMASQGIHVVICGPAFEVPSPPGQSEPLSEQLAFYPLPGYVGHTQLITRSPGLAAATLLSVVRGVTRWDAVGVVAPSAYGLLLAIVGMLRKRRVFLYIRGNTRETLRREYGGRDWQRRAILSAFTLLDTVTRIFARAGVLTFTMGEALARLYRGPRVYSVRGYGRPEIAAEVGAPPILTPADMRQVVYVGRLSREKGVDVLVRAIGLLRDQGCEMSLTIAGDGPERSALLGLVATLGLERSVVFMGHVCSVQELRAVYLAAGIVAVPSYTEGIPVAMIEAMGLGRLIVASNVGGIPSVIRSGENGYMVPPGSSRHLAQALLHAKADIQRSQRLAAAAYAEAQHLTVDRQAEFMLQKVFPG